MHSKTEAKRGRGRKGKSTRKPNQAIETDMKELILLQRQQLRYGQPDVLDIEFPMLKQQVYSTVSNAFAFTIASSTTVATAGAFYFALNQLNLQTSFTQLFDRYRVLHLQLQFNPQVSSPTGGGPLITAIDYDDASTPSLEIQQRDTALVTPVGQYFERTLKPRMAVAAYAGSAFTGYMNTSSDNWIDSSSPNVQFYGLKYYLPIQTTAATVYSVSVRVHLQFKNNF